MTAGAYSIGSNIWPGVSKVIEETGELGQVLGKLMGKGGEVDHWDGSNLMERLYEETSDVLAALEFMIAANGLDMDLINSRVGDKVALFHLWHVTNSE